MRADRLLAILLQLQGHGRTSARELSKKLEVSERTIHRDMEALSAAGIPVYAERGAAGGWELAEGYRTNLTGMNRDEIISLVLSGSFFVAAEFGSGEHFDSALNKLLASLPPGHRAEAETIRRRIFIDGSDWGMRDPDGAAWISLLREAIWREYKVLIRYATDGGQREREVQPLGLVAKGKRWYLMGQTERGLRIYRLARIQAARMTSEKFTRPENFDIVRTWEAQRDAFVEGLSSYPVRMRIRAERFPRFREIPFLRLSEVCEPENGWIELGVDLERQDWAVSVLLGFAADVEVLEPVEFRADMLRIARDLQDLYGSGAPSVGGS